MKVLRGFLALVITMVCLVSLPTCSQILYYLSQVNKVHGTVTVAGTNPPTPLGSVEVFVGDYQYSELTNYYGDYEIELSEGTWTINFRKEGYEPVTAEVTLSPENMRERLDVSMVWIQPPTPINLTGDWVWFFTPVGEPEELGPITLGIQQTDSILVTDLLDFSGSISDSVFTLDSDEVDVHLTGTVSGSGVEIEITGAFTGDVLGGSGTFRMVHFPEDIFGALFAEGTVNRVDIDISAEDALGSGGEMDYRYEYTFPVTVPGFSGVLWLQTSRELTEGWYTIGDEPWGDDGISVRLGDLHAIEEEDVYPQVHITSYDDIAGITGTFDLKFEDGRSVSFAVPDVPNDPPVPASETDDWTFSNFEVDGEDPNGAYLVLWLHVNGALKTGLYEAGQWWVGVEWESPSGDLYYFSINDAGTLTIDRFDNDGIKGSFNASGDWGWLNGNFDVYFFDEWEPED